jgi:hypothetical protein
VRISGVVWVAGLLALGAALAFVAVSHWKAPENSVRWSFTQIHTAVVRGKRDQARRLLAPRITWNGKEVGEADFAARYALPPQAGPIEAVACAKVSGHWIVRMNGASYCFVPEAGTLWRLHWVGPGDCGCK